MSSPFRVIMRADTFMRLTARQYFLAALAFCIVLLVRVGLWLLPSPFIVSRVRRVSRMRRVERASTIDVSTVSWAVDAVSRRVPGATCLTQALAAKILLALVGVEVELCLGVSGSTNGAFRAHAWLERNGRSVVGGEGTRSLTRLPAFPVEAADEGKLCS